MYILEKMIKKRIFAISFIWFYRKFNKYMNTSIPFPNHHTETDKPVVDTSTVLLKQKKKVTMHMQWS